MAACLPCLRAWMLDGTACSAVEMEVMCLGADVRENDTPAAILDGKHASALPGLELAQRPSVATNSSLEHLPRRNGCAAADELCKQPASFSNLFTVSVP